MPISHITGAPSNTQGEDRLKDNYTTPEGGHLSITFQVFTEYEIKTN